MTDSDEKQASREPATTEGNPAIIIGGLVALLVLAILLGVITQP